MLFRSIVQAVSDTPLCLLTVHAHPDDEASKGAPTLARYHAEGVRTVLVCCTGGEEGDLQNPMLREPGQAFHGLSPEQEKELLAAVRPGELAASAAVIGFDAVQSGDRLEFRWRHNLEPGVVEYEIREGDTWEASTAVVNLYADYYTMPAGSEGDRTFWIKAIASQIGRAHV